MSTRNGLQPVGRVNLFREVLASIEQYVDEQRIGARLPSDRELAARLEVSRPLVRQALKVLEGLGRIEMRQGVGTFVCRRAEHAPYLQLVQGFGPNDELGSQLLEARKLIEGAVIRAAFAVRTERTIALLEAVLDEVGAEREGGTEVRMDLRFEGRLGEICGNAVLRRLQGFVHGAWLEVHRAQAPDSMSLAQVHREHAEIATAFRNADLPRALALMDDHLDEVAEIRSRIQLSASNR